MASTLGTYMYGDVLGDIGIMSIQSTFSMVLGIVSLFLCPIISKKIGLEKMVRACLLIGAVCYLGLFGTMMVTNISALVYMVWSSVASGFCGVSIYMQWGLVATVTDYNEYVTGKRTEGTIYGVFNLSRRIGQTVGNSAAVARAGLDRLPGRRRHPERRYHHRHQGAVRADPRHRAGRLLDRLPLCVEHHPADPRRHGRPQVCC